MITKGPYLTEPTKANRSGIIGVCHRPARWSKDKQWHAYGYKDCKKVCLGYHPTKELAVAARKAWEEKRDRETATTN